MDSWERFNETTLPIKKVFYSELYLEDITDEDYLHAQKISRRAQEELKFKKVNIMIYMLKVIHNCI